MSVLVCVFVSFVFVLFGILFLPWLLLLARTVFVIRMLRHIIFIWLWSEEIGYRRESHIYISPTKTTKIAVCVKQCFSVYANKLRVCLCVLVSVDLAASHLNFFDFLNCFDASFIRSVSLHRKRLRCLALYDEHKRTRAQLRKHLRTIQRYLCVELKLNWIYCAEKWQKRIFRKVDNEKSQIWMRQFSIRQFQKFAQNDSFEWKKKGKKYSGCVCLFVVHANCSIILYIIWT